MSVTRRSERITHYLALDGTLLKTEVTHYTKPGVDADNPDMVFDEQQDHEVIDHTDSGTTEDEKKGKGHSKAGDLTVGQRTGIQSGITSTLAALNRVRPLNPGPRP